VLVSDDMGATFDEVELPMVGPHHASVRRPAISLLEPNVALLSLLGVSAQSLIMRPNPGWMPYMYLEAYKALPLGSWPMGFTVRPQITRPAELINGPYTLFFPASGRVLDSTLDWQGDARAPPSPVESLIVCGPAPPSVFALTPLAVFRSEDQGATFTPAFELPGEERMKALACLDASSVHVDTTAGPFASNDGGETFLRLPPELEPPVEPEPAAHAEDGALGLGVPSPLPVLRVTSAVGALGSPNLWALTEKELFTTAPAPLAADGAVPIQAWARRRLRHLVSLPSLVGIALLQRGLLESQVAGTLGGWTTRNLVPRVDASLVLNSSGNGTRADVLITNPLLTNGLTAHADVQAILTLSWFLPELAFPFDGVAGYEAGRAKHGLEMQRKALTAIVTDAYEERLATLDALAGAPQELLAALTSASRVEVLDEFLSHWTRTDFHPPFDKEPP
jgi:hypothetical protein